uniref:N-6 DNA methylase n=1 Tax=Eubacterium cellulosolvens TaxID=29322 RepID=UPI00048015DA|nr:N-6 DNA methylase [[Eubacterium] cellulosolvens]
MLDKNRMNNQEMLSTELISRKIASQQTSATATDSQQNFVLTYLAYVAATNQIDTVEDLRAFIEENTSEQRQMFVKELVDEHLSIALFLAKECNKDDLINYLYVYPRESSAKSSVDCGTPTSIAKLALKLLDIKEEESVADFGSGAGDFLTLTSETCKQNDLYGIELNTYVHEISKIRNELFVERTQIEQGDMFAIPKDRSFDKIFSNYPFGLRLIHLQTGTDYIEVLHQRIPAIKRTTSADWIFNTLIMDHLSDTGKAVAIMTNGSTWNSIDQKIREFFVTNGYVEAVIALPGNLFESTNIPTSMIVFSKKNTSIRLIDATKLCVQGRRQNTITDENIDQILRLLSEDGDEAVTVDLEELQKNEFVLNPSRYLEKAAEIEDGVEFGSLMKRITRGAPLKASDLDELVSESETDTQYLMIANIQDGMIAEDLPYLKEFDPKLEKYCIKNHSLVLSKNGTPFKVALAEVAEGKKIVGNGNLFIIDLDEEKVNPYFLKAFLDSEVGIAVLKSIAVGATIPTVSADALKKLIVPLPSMEKQKEIADLYQAKQDEIKVLRLKIQKAQDDLKNIFKRGK